MRSKVAGAVLIYNSALLASFQSDVLNLLNYSYMRVFTVFKFLLWDAVAESLSLCIGLPVAMPLIV